MEDFTIPLTKFTYKGEFSELPETIKGEPIKNGTVITYRGNVHIYADGWNVIERDNNVMGITPNNLRKGLIANIAKFSLEILQRLPYNDDDISPSEWRNPFYYHCDIIAKDLVNKPESVASCLSRGIVKPVIDYTFPVDQYRYSLAYLGEVAVNALNDGLVPDDKLEYYLDIYMQLMSVYSMIELLFTCAGIEKKENEEGNKNANGSD